MRQELQVQEIAFEKQWGIKRLVKQLKDHLWTEWILQNPGVGAKVYDDDTEKTQYFRPVTGIDNFEYNEVGNRRY